MDSFLFQAVIYLGVATLCVPLAVRMGFGSVLGYLIAGIVIGPLTGLVGSETEALQHFAEFGVVMMLFLIGLELDPKTLWSMRGRLLGLGLGQVVITGAAIAGVAWMLGYTWQVSVAVGMIFAPSSTAIVMQTLNERKLNGTRGGRSSFSVLLAQDIAVLPMLALMPLLGSGGIASSRAAEEAPRIGDGESAQMMADAAGWVDQLPGWGVAWMTVGAVAVVILGGRFLTRPIFTFAGRARLREMNTIVSLLFVIGVAVLMTLVGLSPALGAFLAGVVLANSEFRHELQADIEPFKGLLLGLFFITVGAGIDFGTLIGAPFTVAATVVGLMAIKGAILFGLTLLSRLKGRDRILFTLSLAQAGEFGFVLVSVAVTDGVFGAELSAILLLSIALSMLLTPLLFIANDHLAARSRDHSDTAPDDEIDEKGEVIIAGVGRFGQVIQRMLHGLGLTTVVLDRDIQTIQLLRTFGLKTYMGDPLRPEMLEAAGLSTAKVLVIALDDRAGAVRLARMAKAANPDIHVIARAYDRVHVYELYRAGADQIVRENFDSSLRAGRYVLEKLGWSETDAHAARDAYFRHDREMLLDLAKLWKPGVPIDRNPEYAARAREYNKGLENALLARFGENPEAARAVTSDDEEEEVVAEAPDEKTA
ncbi:monovalent cation:proton antiporter-2 (CPA2) family protein [Jannaschia rubra]|uniref:K(+)/H(+) antiporter n=1 Tax=Jannaschia rubra TaxID=282197 RepID=A0A0M6XVA1_9RHOB|nr:monovalent cation:proton antiporter-2 (CPA2) family protein [Jannaschia rubra]CTQ33884.1 K(+)/H(+) antiporter [Jannaschia rubra]SFG11640.1 Kef-type potassium/proton antiporter, CPA2 family [Jannaschia rubra]